MQLDAAGPPPLHNGSVALAPRFRAELRRRRQGKSIPQLAKELEVSRDTLTRAINGEGIRRPTARWLESQIARGGGKW